MASFQTFIPLILALFCSISSLTDGLQFKRERQPLDAHEELAYDDFHFESLVHRERRDTSAAGDTRRHEHDTLDSSSGGPFLVLNTNRLSFSAFQRHFEIYLKRDITLLADKVDIEVRYDSSPHRPAEHMADFLTSNYYTGFVSGEARSHVSCYFERPASSRGANQTQYDQQPLVYAQIQLQNESDNEIYYVEPFATTTTGAGDDQNHQYKYIIYRISDVQSDVLAANRFNQTVCGAKHFDGRARGSDQSFVFTNSSFYDEVKTRVHKRQASQDEQDIDSDSDDEAEADADARQRQRRAQPRLTPGANRCYLALVADHRFFKEIGNSNVKLTTAYLINIIGSINNIFTRTVWNPADVSSDEKETGESSDASDKMNKKNKNNGNAMTNFGFSVEKVIIHTEPTPASAPNAPPHYNSATSSTNADTVLELFGEEDWSSYCLAHLFTFQSFENSVLGLAYVSSPLSYALGGICSAGSGRSRNLRQSVNTGLSSYKSISSQQVRLLQREAELVTAHEFGHNWGSEHDPVKAECTPSSANGGNFIMFAFANQGHERNNYYFSPCTINAIGEVLKSKSSRCFKAEASSYCGNDRIEADEECDAGLRGRQGLDECCDAQCRLRPGAQCSDANHYCCQSCRMAPRGRRCYSSPSYIDCFEDHSYCTGESKDCPSQSPKRVGTKCNSFDSGVCNANGQCLSLCQQQDMAFFPCQCAPNEQKCMLCCRKITPIPTLNTSVSSSSSSSTGTNSQCLPIHQTFPNVYTETVFLSNGRACHNGICENRVCNQRVKDYVSRFWKVIQTATVSGFVEFMKRNIVGSIIIISLGFWVPISCCIHFCNDKRNSAALRRKLYEQQSSSLRVMSKSEESHPLYT